jgi:hypothetical protein
MKNTQLHREKSPNTKKPRPARNVPLPDVSAPAQTIHEIAVQALAILNYSELTKVEAIRQVGELVTSMKQVHEAEGELLRRIEMALSHELRD